jgi:hypothetical protein
MRQVANFFISGLQILFETFDDLTISPVLHEVKTVVKFNFLNNEIPELSFAINKQKVIE